MASVSGLLGGVMVMMTAGMGVMKMTARKDVTVISLPAAMASVLLIPGSVMARMTVEMEVMKMTARKVGPIFYFMLLHIADCNFCLKIFGGFRLTFKF